MEGRKNKGVDATFSSKSGKLAFLAVLVVCSLALTACETCVRGKATINGAPLQYVGVQVLDANGGQIGYASTGPDGEYCIDNVPLTQCLTVRASFAGLEITKTICTGTRPSTCASAFCTEADFTFTCDMDSLTDPLEPNNTCTAASVVSLPYSNTITSLCPPGDVDFYTFNVPQDGMTLVAQTYYPGNGESINALIGLLDSQCNVLAWNGGQGVYPILEYLLLSAGTYYVAVTGYNDPTFQGNHRELGTYGIDIQLTRPSCVNVRVTDEGVPLAGANIYPQQASEQPCMTDSTGVCCFSAYQGIRANYTICHPTTGECVVASAIPSQPGSCSQGGCEDLAFDFNHTCVSGIVTREGGPVENAWVCDYFANLSTCKYTAADGSFCLIAPGDSEGYVTVQDPLFSGIQLQSPVTSGDGGRCGEGGCTELDFDLPGITCISGQVTRGNEPGDGITVQGPAGYAVTGVDGSYCVKAPKGSDVLLCFYDPITSESRCDTVTTGVEGTCEQGGCTSHDVQFSPISCIQGTITRQGGVPAEYVRVCASPGECVNTDTDGHYCIKAVIGTNILLNLYDPVTSTSYGQGITTTGEASCVNGPCTEFDYELPAAACVHGVVTRGSVPEEGVRVCWSWSSDVCYTTDAQGNYCLPAPVLSTVYLSAQDPILGESVPGYTQTGPAASCAAGVCSSLNFQLREATCISGIVREGTQPLPNAWVYNSFGSVYTDQNGQYCLPAPANEKNSIVAVHPVDQSEIIRYPLTGGGGRCDQGGCTTQNFTFDIKSRVPSR